MSTPVLAGIIEKAVRRALRGMYFNLPAQVVSYDAETQTCTAQITILGSDVNEEGVRVPARDAAIENVPVMWLSGGGGAHSITLPLQPGDYVELRFSSRSLDRWLTRGGIDVKQGSERTQHIKDAIAMAGLRPAPDKLPEDAVHDTAMVLRGPEVRIGSSNATEPPVLGDSFREALNTLLDAIVLFAGTTTGGGAPALEAAVNDFKAGWAGYLAEKVKVE